MAARSGGFGGGLNPFGTGSISNLGQYNIGADLADLETYKVEVAWGNGTASDDEYLAALRKSVDATDPDTQARATAQNKLDDATYRIGRSKVEGDLDALIAFDQHSLGSMNQDNLRYRDIQQSLDSELANRRSRDYGKLVDDYNAGKTSTDSLLQWVKHTLSGLSPDDPDFDNWTGVQQDLVGREQDEKDTQVYQDFQNDRMKPAAFLAYIQSRRDSYDPSSPKYQEWSNKLEDATKQVHDTAQAKADTAFFNKYEEGKVSDKAYLKYLRTRIGGMTADDPDLPQWQHRLNQAAFSLAEDKLRFDVQTGKAKVSKLIDFYRNYRLTLNPGSAEYRTIQRAIIALKGQGATGGTTTKHTGAGGTSGAKGSSPTGALGQTVIAKGQQGSPLDKLIDPKNTIKGDAGGLFQINPNASRKQIAAAKKYLDLNMQNLGNALQDGDPVYLFQDPRHPGQTVQGRYPDGTLMVDAKGKPVMVQGSAYLPASNEVLTNLLVVEAGNWQAAAQVALHNKKYGDYAYYLKRASEDMDNARKNDSTTRAQNLEDLYDAQSKAIDKLTQQGEFGPAMQLATQLAAQIAGELNNPYLTTTQRTKLENLGDKLESNPLMTVLAPDGSVVRPGAVNTGALQSGNVVLNPGWHMVLGSDKNGAPDYKPQFDDRQDGSWESTHVRVLTTVGGKVVPGDVPLSSTPTNPMVVIQTDDGQITVPIPGGKAQFFSYQDENGRTVRSYSIDGGKTWISPGYGQPAPMIQIAGKLSVHQNPDDGTTQLEDSNGTVVLTLDANGGVKTFTPPAGSIDWYGVGDYNNALANPSVKLDGDSYSEISMANRAVGTMSVGAPGQKMTLATTSPTGQINMTGHNLFTPGKADLRYSSMTKTQKSNEAKSKAAMQQARSGSQSEALPQIMDAGTANAQAAVKARGLSGDTNSENARINALAPSPPDHALPARTPVSIPQQLPPDTPVTLLGAAIGTVSVPPLIKTVAPVHAAAGSVKKVVPPPIKKAPALKADTRDAKTTQAQKQAEAKSKAAMQAARVTPPKPVAAPPSTHHAGTGGA